MFTTNLFNNCNPFALLQKMLIFDGIFDDVLIVFLPELSGISFFSRQKFCVFVSGVSFQLVEIAIDCGLNVSFNGSLNIFRWSILVSSLR